MFYRIDCERLNEIINENNQFSRNGETRFRETVKPNFAEEGKPSPRTRETTRRGEGKTNFDLTENTTEITSENTTESKTLLAHPLTRLHQRVLPDRNIHRNLNRPGRNIPNVLVVIPSQQPSKALESPNQGRCDTRNHAQRCETLCCLGACLRKYRHPVREAGVDVLWDPIVTSKISGNSQQLPEVGDSDRSMSPAGLGAMSDKFGKSSDKLTF